MEREVSWKEVEKHFREALEAPYVTYLKREKRDKGADLVSEIISEYSRDLTRKGIPHPVGPLLAKLEGDTHPYSNMLIYHGKEGILLSKNGGVAMASKHSYQRTEIKIDGKKAVVHAVEGRVIVGDDRERHRLHVSVERIEHVLPKHESKKTALVVNHQGTPVLVQGHGLGAVTADLDMELGREVAEHLRNLLPRILHAFDLRGIYLLMKEEPAEVVATTSYAGSFGKILVPTYSTKAIVLHHGENTPEGERLKVLRDLLGEFIEILHSGKPRDKAESIRELLSDMESLLSEEGPQGS